MSSMKLYHEHKISERVDELCHVIRERASVPGRPLDFSEYLRYVTDPSPHGTQTIIILTCL